LGELYTIHIVTIHDTYGCIFVLQYIVTQYIVTLLLIRRYLSDSKTLFGR